MEANLSHGSAVRDRAFFLAMALAAGLTVFLGFAPSYYLNSITHTTHYPTGLAISTSRPLLIHLHALAFSSWMLLFIAQNALVVSGRINIHRRLGIAGAILVPVMTVLGIVTAVRGARDGWNPGGPFADPMAFMAVGIGDICVFSVFAVAGLCCRRRPTLHKRLMLLATLGGLIWPAITRMPYVAGRPVAMFGLLTALVLAPAIYDRISSRRFQPVSLWGGLSVLAVFFVRVPIGRTAAWHSFAAWLLRW